MKKRKKSVYKPKGEVVLYGIPKEGVPELKIRYTRTRKTFLGKITDAESAATFIRKLYTRGTIELQEVFIVLYLNQQHEIIGFYKHSTGGISVTVTDRRLILGAALKSASVAMVLAHNHPSGNIQPSDADIKATEKIVDAAKLFDIEVLDHIIVTKKDYYSIRNMGFK